MANDVKLLAGLLTQVVQDKLVDATGKVLAEVGDTIVILPQTTARAVLVGDEQSLEDLWDTLSKTGHIHRCFGVCSTAAATVEKIVTVADFNLVDGAEVTVRFTVTNTANNPTLNVNGTGAKAIQYRNAAISKGYLAANRTYQFVYDGTNYQLVGDINTDTNTKVTQTLTTTNAEYALLVMADAAATGNKTNTVRFASAVTLNPSTGIITASGFKGTLTGNVTGNVSGSSGSCTGNSATATKATQDGSGNNIVNTYSTKADTIKALSVSGKTITYTKADNTTGTITTQDTDTHWTTTLYAGAKDAKSNAVTTNGNAYLKLFDNDTRRSQLNIKGTGATTVTTDANGVITINSTNTTYNKATSSADGLMSKEDKANFDTWAEKLSNFQTELIRWTDRTTKLETWAAANGYSLS